MSSCFISDLHLDDAREDVKKTFFKFLDDEAPKFDNLYILGDLFEVWIGDDYQDTLSVEVIRRLKAFSHTGKKIYFMHGNRDFLLGHKFAESCGGEIISDPYVFKVKDKKIMLSHGDIFCIDDLDYQNFKNTVRSEKWKTNFLSKDLSERNAIAKKLREESAQKNLEKKAFLMDVNKGEVNRVAQKYDIDILIHGHVHRPKTHIEDYGTRIVLGDWDRKYWFITLIDQEVNLISGKVK